MVKVDLLEPLTEEQQKEVVVKRLGEGEPSDVPEYLSNPERVPLDYETKHRVTGNPLMLEKDATIEVKMRGRGGGCVGAKEASSVKEATMAAAVPQLAAGSAAERAVTEAERAGVVSEAKPKSRRGKECKQPKGGSSRRR